MTSKAKIKTFFLLSFIVVLFYTYKHFVEWLKSPEVFPIRLVKLDNQVLYQSPKEIQQVAFANAKCGFFGVDLIKLTRDLNKLPWIDSVKVSRVWPGTLAIRVKEQEPIARWGSHAVMTLSGDIIVARASSKDTTDKLPIFNAMQRYRVKTLEVYLQTQGQLEQANLLVNELKMMPDGGFLANVNNGIDIYLGRTDLPGRLKRFVLAYNGSLKNKISQIKYIDLRYTNGVSVGWKT